MKLISSRSINKITRFVFIALFSIAFIIPIKAQTSVWKVTKDGKSVFLIGTIHLLRESDYPLPNEFNQAYEESSKIILEADIDGAKDPATLQSAIMKMMYEPGKSLKTELTPENYQRLSDLATAAGLPMVALDNFKPGMASLTISMVQLQSKEAAQDGVDVHFLNKAKEDGKSVEFLESVELQMDLIANMGVDNPNEYIKQYLEDEAKTEENFDEMVKNWRSGKGKAFSKEYKKMRKTSPAMYKSMLVDRNDSWLPIIRQYLADKGIEMILMGAAHLHGPDGILTKLKSEGYKVKQIKA